MEKSVKSIFLQSIAGLILAFVLTGCSTVYVPNYLKDEQPYKKRFFVEYNKTYEATVNALIDLGWKIEGTADPKVYERNPADDLNGEQILIFTKVRMTPLFLGTRYGRLNAFIRSNEKVSEVEIRYLTINALPFRNIREFKNDSAANRILGRIEEELGK